MKTFKEYENIDKSCEECIFEHELEGIQEQNIKVKRSNLMTQFVVVVRSFMFMLKNEKGNVIKVSFGDTTGLSIKRDDPLEEKALELGTIVIIQDLKQKQGTGHVINGEQEQR